MTKSIERAARGASEHSSNARLPCMHKSRDIGLARVRFVPIPSLHALFVPASTQNKRRVAQHKGRAVRRP